jgi:hypothetical protein
MTRFMIIAMLGMAAHLTGQQPDIGAAPGNLVDIGGQRLHLLCSGAGAPTVVLESLNFRGPKLPSHNYLYRCRFSSASFDVSVNPNGDSTMTAPTLPAQPFASPVIVGGTAPSGASRSVIAGRILSGLITVLLAFDAVAKIAKVSQVIEGSAQLGYPEVTIQGIGITLLACVVLYAIPATSILGAVLLTGYLGGAVATHVRVLDPVFSHILFPTYVAAIAWAGLYLRDARVRALCRFADDQ